MRFLICLGLSSLFALTCTARIRAHRNALYVLAALLALGTGCGAALGLEALLPPAVELVLWRPLARGSLATALFALVMYAGALPDGSPVRRKLLSIRGELSILAGLLTLGHNLAAGQVYFVRLVTAPGSLPRNQLLAALCSLVLLALLLPLLVTSFPAVRRRMPGRRWKQLQRLAYLFYGLTYVHVVLLFLPDAREGSVSALVNLAVFSAVFLGYAALRLRKALGRSRLRPVPAAAALLLFALVVLPALPRSDGGQDPADPADPGVRWQDGVYTGKGRGYGGPVQAEVTVSEDRITGVRITDHREDEPYWKKAQVTIPRILEAQTPSVDTVAGATKSCKGIQRAVRDALKQAERGR